MEIADHLDRGDIDLAIGALPPPGERFSDLRLFEDRFACVLRKDHPAVQADGTLSAAGLAACRNLEVSSSGEATEFIDAELARLGLERLIALRRPLLATAGILAQSDMVAVMTERAARAFARTAPLQVLPLPLASPPVTVAMLWHRRVDDLPAHRWLRGIVSRLARSL